MPVLRFNKLPDRALVEVRKALDADEGFRSRVLESLSESSLDAMQRGARLFLERPPGWEDMVEVLVEEVSQEADRSGILQREAEATRRAQQLADALERTRTERDEAREDLVRARSAGDEARRSRDQLQGRVANLTEELQTMAEERAEAVRQLGDARDLAERRLVELREMSERLATLEAAPTSGTDTGTGENDGAEARTGTAPSAVDPEASAALTEAAGSAHQLAVALRRVASKLGPGDPITPSGATGPEDAPAAAPSSGEAPGVARPGRPESSPEDRSGHEPKPRRRAVRLGRGLSSDSVEGLDEFLGRPETFVIVDGYNVSMAGWPDQSPAMQRESLLRSLATVSAVAAADIHVVFDGAHDGARPAVSTPLPVRVHFTEAGVEADDRILEFVDDAPLDDAVVVVSTDARVRRGAQERGAVPISSATLLQRLRR